MRSRQGLTLLEMLIAVGILGIIFLITSQGIVTSLNVQASQESVTSSQAKLRRVTEVLTQELRSAVLGAISNQPYASSPSAISFVLLNGGAGYQVLPHDSGLNSSFKRAANVQVIAAVPNAGALGLQGNQALMVNDAGQAVIFDVTDVTRRGGAGSLEYNVVHPGCANTIDYTENTLLFSVQSVGFSYVDTSQTLFQRSGSAAAVPLAFDLSTFRIDYIYQQDDGTIYTRTTPLLDANGVPSRTGVIGGFPVTLVRLQVVLGSNALAADRSTSERIYSSQIELASTAGSRNIEAVSPCN